MLNNKKHYKIKVDVSELSEAMRIGLECTMFGWITRNGDIIEPHVVDPESDVLEYSIFTTPKELAKLKIMLDAFTHKKDISQK